MAKHLLGAVYIVWKVGKQRTTVMSSINLRRWTESILLITQILQF
jgi:hypothetical protein